MAKTLFSVELESNSWCDDTLNGTLDECKSYIKEEYACHYILDTGKPRGCPASKCPYYTTEPCYIIDDVRYTYVETA